MSSYIPMQAGAVPIHTIVQDALRAAVHAKTEREGFDLLANALRRVSQSAVAGRHTDAELQQINSPTEASDVQVNQCL